MTTILQHRFNQILAGQIVEALFFDKKEYDSFRVSLLRKYRNYADLVERLGGNNSYDGQFLRCSWNGEECKGTFQLREETSRKNNPNKAIFVKEL